MKLIKGLLGVVVIGVQAGFLLSLITPQLDLSSDDLATEFDDEEF